MPTDSNAFPSDQAMASAGITSMRSVGLDSGNRMGRSTPAHSALMTASVKAP